MTDEALGPARSAFSGPRSATRLDVAVGLLLAVLCAAGLCSPAVPLRLLGPYEAVHFSFVEQEQRTYDLRASGELVTFVDPWGRSFVEKDLSGVYALYSRGVNGLDEEGRGDDILMYGPGLPCYRFGHTGVGTVVSWARIWLFGAAAINSVTYVLLRAVPRRATRAGELALTGFVGLPLACFLGAVANEVHGRALSSGLERSRLVSPDVFVGGSVLLATCLGSFALRRLHGPEH